MGRTGVLSARDKNNLDRGGGLGEGGSQHFVGHRVAAIGINSSKLTYLRLTSITDQHLIGTFSGATSGSGITLTSSVTKALGVYADDGGAAIGSGTFARAIVGRHLLTYTGGNREQEAAGVVGQIVSSTGTNRHNMCGVMGSYEARTSLTVDGQAAATDTWCQAAVIGRVGGASITVNTNGVLAGLAAMSNITSGQLTDGGSYCGVYVGAWSGTTDWTQGIRLETGKMTTGMFVGTMTTGIDFNGTFNKCINFANVTLTAGSSNQLWSYGDAAVGAVSVTITDYWFPVRMNVASIANPSAEKLAALMFLKFATTTAHQANLDIQGIGLTIDVGKNVGYAHGMDVLVDISASASTTTGTIIGGKFTVDLSSGATLTHGVGDNLSAVCALVTGTGGYSGGMEASCIEARKAGATTIDHGLWVNVLTGATITNGITFAGAGTITNAMHFHASAVTVGSISTGHGGTLKTVKCDIDGTAYYLILSTSPS
jgi:hypothetical protein